MPAGAATRASLARLLKKQHDVVSLKQLAELKLTRDFARAQVAAGRWQRVHDGVYCAYSEPLTYYTRCQAALLLVGDDAALDADTAAYLEGYTAHPPRKVHVVVRHARRPRVPRDKIALRRCRVLTDRSFRQRHGMRVIRIDHALCAMAYAQPKKAHHVLAAGVQKGLTRADILYACILVMGPRKGRADLLATLSGISGDARSGLEIEFLRLLHAAGLRLPTPNHPLVIDGRRLWLDLAYVDRRIAIEIDGRAYHLLAEDWEDDLDRQNAVVLDGWCLLRFTARAIRRQPDRVVAQLRQALGQADRGVA